MNTLCNVPDSETHDTNQTAHSRQSDVCSPADGESEPSVQSDARDGDSAEASSLSKEFASEMLLKSDSRPLMLILVDACRRIFANCEDLTPEKVTEIRELMRKVRPSDVGLPENMSLSNIEYIHVLEVPLQGPEKLIHFS